MGRGTGANTKLAFAFESTYGTPPGAGYVQMPFVSEGLGDEQPLVASNLLGQGREPLPPSLDVITNNGDLVVPLDLRYFGFWLKLLFGAPTSTQGTAAIGSIEFSDQPATAMAITIGGADLTFKSATPGADECLIGATLAETLANAVIALNASTTAALKSQSYSLNVDGKTIDIVSDTIGVGGNSVTLAADVGSNATVSGATLSGGSATGPYNHVFTSGGLTLPSAAVEVGVLDVPSYGMNFGVAADKLAIQLETSGNLNATISLIAQGEKKAKTSSAGTPTELVIERFTNFSAQVSRDGVPLANLTGGTYNYANGLDPVRVIRPDGRIAGVDPGVIAVTGKNDMRFADTTFIDLAVNNTPVEFVHEWAITSAKKLRIVTHYAFLPKPKTPVTGPGGIQASFDWQAAKHPVLAKTCTATLINDKPSY